MPDSSHHPYHRWEESGMRVMGAYIHGVPIFVWVPIFVKTLVGTEMGAYIHGVPIIPILRYCQGQSHQLPGLIDNVDVIL